MWKLRNDAVDKEPNIFRPLNREPNSSNLDIKQKLPHPLLPPTIQKAIMSNQLKVGIIIALKLMIKSNSRKPTKSSIKTIKKLTTGMTTTAAMDKKIPIRSRNTIHILH